MTVLNLRKNTHLETVDSEKIFAFGRVMKKITNTAIKEI